MEIFYHKTKIRRKKKEKWLNNFEKNINFQLILNFYFIFFMLIIFFFKLKKFK